MAIEQLHSWHPQDSRKSNRTALFTLSGTIPRGRCCNIHYEPLAFAVTLLAMTCCNTLLQHLPSVLAIAVLPTKFIGYNNLCLVVACLCPFSPFPPWWPSSFFHLTTICRHALGAYLGLKNAMMWVKRFLFHSILNVFCPRWYVINVEGFIVYVWLPGHQGRVWGQYSQYHACFHFVIPTSYSHNSSVSIRPQSLILCRIHLLYISYICVCIVATCVRCLVMFHFSLWNSILSFRVTVLQHDPIYSAQRTKRLLHHVFSPKFLHFCLLAQMQS